MSFTKADFITSAPGLKDCPPPDLPEFCMAGRSNVGKSSLINRIVNRKNLARTSNTPGKTQQMNYYRIDDRLYLVDLPGFGYAKVPEKERKRWGNDIREYLLKRETLELVLHLVDARHEPAKLDDEFFYWLGSNRIPFGVILTKSDKISKNKQQQATSKLRKILFEMNIDVPVIISSAETGQGIPEIRKLILDFALTAPNKPSLKS